MNTQERSTKTDPHT